MQPNLKVDIPRPTYDWNALKHAPPSGSISLTRESLTMLAKRIQMHADRSAKIAERNAQRFQLAPPPDPDANDAQEIEDRRYKTYTESHYVMGAAQAELGAAVEAELRLVNASLDAVRAAEQAILILNNEPVAKSDRLDHPFVENALKIVEGADTARVSDDPAYADRKGATISALETAVTELKAANGAHARRYGQALKQREASVSRIARAMAPCVKYLTGENR